jgi:hypothetical protein
VNGALGNESKVKKAKGKTKGKSGKGKKSQGENQREKLQREENAKGKSGKRNSTRCLIPQKLKLPDRNRQTKKKSLV